MKRKNLRILVVSQYFWPENFRINDLVLGLQERGNQITVLTGVPNYPGGRLFPGYGYFNKLRDNFNGVDVFRAPLIPRGVGDGTRLALNFFSFAACASILGPLICMGKFDVVLVYEPSPISVAIPGIVLKISKSAPLMFWMQDLWPQSLSATGAVRSRAILKMVEMMVRLIYLGCDRILAQSRAFCQSIIDLGGKSECIYYYPNSAESLYRPIDIENDAPERIQMPDGFRITFAGNIGAAQDFETILSAAEELKDFKDIHLVVLGDGRKFPWVQEQVRRRGLEHTVHLLGRHPAEKMPRYFALSDALLVTLRKEPIFALTIPSKIQSYLACARPIIAALDGEGARIIDESEAGISCPAENPRALADAILKLYRMTEADRENIGQNGKKYFDENFEREMLLDRLEEWMQEMVAHGNTKSIRSC
ncbi:glycosyltransferase family 4 protein [Thermodesulfobacteriota bacterium]